MCRRTTCKTCGKPNWAGCGAHVEQVLGDVPKSERCRCRESSGAAASATRPPAKSGVSKSGGSKGAPEAVPSTFGRFKAWLHQ